MKKGKRIKKEVNVAANKEKKEALYLASTFCESTGDDEMFIIGTKYQIIERVAIWLADYEEHPANIKIYKLGKEIVWDYENKIVVDF